MTNDAGGSGAPRFDVVLRGYDRRQVDEHVARMQRIIGRMRADLELARSQPLPIIPAPSVGVNTAGPTPPGGRPRPSPRPRPGGSPDVVGGFTDRMQSILQTAEEEAAEIRKKAHASARSETQAARAEVAELARRREFMLAELGRLRGQLESLLSGPTAQMPAARREGAPSPTRRSGKRPSPGPATGPEPTTAQPTSAQAATAEPTTTAQPTTAPRQAPVTGPQPVAPLAPGDPPAPSSSDDPAVNEPTGADPSPNGSPLNGSGPRATNGAVTQETPAPTVQAMPTTVVAEVPQADGQPAARPNGKAANARGRSEPSMRPRTEPEPEPGDLFRPAGEGRAAVEATVKVSAVRPAADPTIGNPVVRPEDESGEPDTAARKPSSSRSG